jgi:hypothetical protein
MQCLLYNYLGYTVVNPVALSWRIQKVIRYIVRNLMLLSPLFYYVEVTAHVFCVEVDECLRVIVGRRLVPDLAEHANVDRTHQLLAQDVETMRCLLVSNRKVSELAVACCSTY